MLCSMCLWYIVYFIFEIISETDVLALIDLYYFEVTTTNKYFVGVGPRRNIDIKDLKSTKNIQQIPGDGRRRVLQKIEGRIIFYGAPFNSIEMFFY